MIRLLRGLWLIKAFFIEILNSSLNNLSICSSNFSPSYICIGNTAGVVSKPRPQALGLLYQLSPFSTDCGCQI